MIPRLHLKHAAVLGRYPWENKPEVWMVLSPDLREEEFEGTLEDCTKYLRTSCPTGKCED